MWQKQAVDAFRFQHEKKNYEIVRNSIEKCLNDVDDMEQGKISLKNTESINHKMCINSAMLKLRISIYQRQHKEKLLIQGTNWKKTSATDKTQKVSIQDIYINSTFQLEKSSQRNGEKLKKHFIETESCIAN